MESPPAIWYPGYATLCRLSIAAVLARLESDAAKADIPAALTALGKLPEATRAPALAWIAKAQAREAALSSARQYAADTARALGPKVGTQ